MRSSAVIAAMVAVLATSAQVDAQCKTDAMCSAGQLCKAGTCVNKAPAQAPKSAPATQPAAVPQPVPIPAQAPAVEAAPPPATGSTDENTAHACSDHIDNDGDGFTDCADQDCFAFSFCGANPPAAGLSHHDRYERRDRRERRERGPMLDTGETRGITALIVAGPVLFGITYIITLSVTSIATDHKDRARATDYAAIPIAGPWVMLGSSLHTTDVEAPLIMSGILQAAGVAMTVIGLAVRRPVYAYGPSAQSSGLQLAEGLSISPTAMPHGGAGLQLRLSRF